MAGDASVQPAAHPAADGEVGYVSRLLTTSEGRAAMHERFGGMLTDEVVGALGYESVASFLEQHARSSWRKKESLEAHLEAQYVRADFAPLAGRGRGCRLRSLECSHNPIGEAGLAALASGVRRCPQLQQLGVRYINLEPTASDAQLLSFVLHPLLECASLRSLDLSYNFITATSSSSVDDLREALASNASITCLSLRRCCIGGWRRARAIARGLARNTTLTSIDLSYNGLGAAAQQEHSDHRRLDTAWLAGAPSLGLVPGQVASRLSLAV